MSAMDVLLRLRLSGQKAVDAGLTKTANTADKTGSRLQRTHGRIGSSFGGMAKRAIGAGAAMAGAYASIAGAKKAVTVTTDLAKTTIGLSRNLGLSTEQASRWAAVATARGIDGKALNMSFGKLATAATAGAKGTKAQVTAFKALGITQGELKSMNFDQTLKASADGLMKMKPGAERTALSMKLFGRGWQTVVPILRGGSKAMNEQLALADKYGVTFKGKTIKSLEDLVAAQRESKFATMGLQVAFGTMLAPILIKVLTHVNEFVAGMHSGTGAGGQFAAAATQVWTQLSPLKTILFGLTGLLIKHPSLITAIIIAYGGFRILTTVAVGLRAVNAAFIAMRAARAAAAAFWVLNAAMLANPAILIAATVIAVGAAFYALYTKVGWVRRAVTNVWNFIKKNWPLLGAILAGPIGLAILGIVKNFGRIKGAAKAAINAVISVFNAGIGLINAITPGKISMPGPIPDIPGIPDIPKIPKLARGGNITRAGAAVVGDRGPEVLSMPAGARVTPLGGAGAAAAASGAGAGRTIVTHVHVMLDRREIGLATAKQWADEAAFS